MSRGDEETKGGRSAERCETRVGWQNGASGGGRVTKRNTTRRKALQRVSAAAAALLLPARVLAQSPPPEAITPALISAARQEGKVHLYTAMEIAAAERYARIFETKFPGVQVQSASSRASRRNTPRASTTWISSTRRTVHMRLPGSAPVGLRLTFQM